GPLSRSADGGGEEVVRRAPCVPVGCGDPGRTRRRAAGQTRDRTPAALPGSHHPRLTAAPMRSDRPEPARTRTGTQIDSAPSAREVFELVEKRYLRRGLALAVTASIALAACTQTPGSSPAPSGSTAAATRGAGGDLKILYWQAVTLLNPHLTQSTKDFDGSRLVVKPRAAMGPNRTTP